MYNVCIFDSIGMISFSIYKLNSVANGTLISYNIYFNRFGNRPIPAAPGDLLNFSKLLFAYIIPRATICSIHALPYSSSF